jgi:hypothetical protein
LVFIYLARGVSTDSRWGWNERNCYGHLCACIFGFLFPFS